MAVVWLTLDACAAYVMLLLLQVCLSTVGVLGDISRNVETDLLPYCDEIMQLLIHNLGSNDVHRSIKPQVRSWGVPAGRHRRHLAFGDAVRCLLLR